VVILCKLGREGDLYEDSILFSEALKSLRRGIEQYLLAGLGRSEDRGAAIMHFHRAMELLFKLGLETVGTEWDRRWKIPDLVSKLKEEKVQVGIGWNRLSDWRNKVKHEGWEPSKKNFEYLVRDKVFPLLRDFLTIGLKCDLEEILPIHCEVLKGGHVNWDLRARILAMAAVEYLNSDLAKAVRMAKRGLEEAVKGLAYENREVLEGASLERAEEGDYIPPLEQWGFGDVLEAFQHSVGNDPEDYVPYSGFILPEDIERIKESIIPRELRESPPRYAAYRFVSTACDWAFRFADALQLTPRPDTTDEIRMRWDRIMDALREETPDVYAMVAQIDPESIEVRGDTLWIRGYKTEQQREALNEMIHKHKQDITRAIQDRGDISDHVDLDIRVGNPLDEALGPPFYMLERYRRRVVTGGKPPLGDQWDEW